MQERIDISDQNPYFLPQILSLQEQKKRLICINHNQANSVCISKDCLFSGLMCLQKDCQCRQIHEKCHYTSVNRILLSIRGHQKQISPKIKEIYNVIYDMINEMIQKLSNLRTKFEKQEHYFGLRQKQWQFLELINDQKINQINGKIVNSLEKTFDTQIEIPKNQKDDIIKDFQSKQKEIDKLCKSIEQSYMLKQIQFTSKMNIHQQLFLNDSKIIVKNQDKQMIKKWISQYFNNRQNFKSSLLFRASENNFSADKFSNSCKGQRYTLTIIKNQFEKIIGGFTFQEWMTIYIRQENQEKKVKNKTFIFSLDLKQKYKYTRQYDSVQTKMHFGPIFGDLQLVISDWCDKNNSSYCHFGNSFNLYEKNRKKYQCNDQQTNILITGDPLGNFKVTQYQVYQIKLNNLQKGILKNIKDDKSDYIDWSN